MLGHPGRGHAGRGECRADGNNAEWAIEKAAGALSGVKTLLSATPPGRFG